jgi:hypothetical protein
LNVTTVYFDSIELEWKPGGISEISYYTIRYRKSPTQSDLPLTKLIQIDEDNNNNNDDYDYDLLRYNSYYNEYDFISFNTTATNYKVKEKLEPYTFYDFEVTAVNVVGESEPTQVLHVRTAARSKFIKKKKL